MGRLIPLSIWRDPEFIGLSSGAQWLWFALQTSDLGEREYDPEYALTLCASLDRFDLYDYEAELRRTSYRTAFIPRKVRPAIPTSLRTQVYARDGYRCISCGVDRPLSLDHVYPYSLGGEDTLENLQTLCRSCNSRKGARV